MEDLSPLIIDSGKSLRKKSIGKDLKRWRARVGGKDSFFFISILREDIEYVELLIDIDPSFLSALANDVSFEEKTQNTNVLQFLLLTKGQDDLPEYINLFIRKYKEYSALPLSSLINNKGEIDASALQLSIELGLPRVTKIFLNNGGNPELKLLNLADSLNHKDIVLMFDKRKVKN